MANIDAAKLLLDRFKKLVQDGKHEEAKSELTKLKLMVIQFQSLVPMLKDTPTKDKERMIARDMLEHAVLLAAHSQDDALFTRNFTQLKAFYTDLRAELPASAQEYPILGLNLLRLLTQNRIAEFHVELELLDEAAQASPHIAFARELEQQLMEGMYGKLRSTSAAAPSPHMKAFLQQLTATVRDELASCSEAAYAKLLLKDAGQLLGFQTQQELLRYCEAQGWQHDSQYVSFAKADSRPVELANLDVFHNMLKYARELDRII